MDYKNIISTIIATFFMISMILGTIGLARVVFM
jgi:hypothetical protein